MVCGSRSLDQLRAFWGGNIWFAEFRHGRRSLEDEERWGRQVEVTTDDNISELEDSRVTVAQLEELVEISSV